MNKIRTALANMLIWLAMKLTPESKKRIVQRLHHYKAQKIGTAWGVAQKDIKSYMICHKGSSYPEAKERVIQEMLSEQSDVILVKASSLIEHRTYNKHGQTIVESRLNVYVPTEVPKAEPTG